jgi:hypothetical protein
VSRLDRFLNWAAGFYEQGRAQSMTRFVAFGCLCGMACLVLAADVLAIAYAWAVATGKPAPADPSGAIAALGVPMIGLAGAAYGALQQRGKTAPEGSGPAAGAPAPRLTQVLEAPVRTIDPVDGITYQPTRGTP